MGCSSSAPTIRVLTSFAASGLVQEEEEKHITSSVRGRYWSREESAIVYRMVCDPPYQCGLCKYPPHPHHWVRLAFRSAVGRNRQGQTRDDERQDESRNSSNKLNGKRGGVREPSSCQRKQRGRCAVRLVGSTLRRPPGSHSWPAGRWWMLFAKRALEKEEPDETDPCAKRLERFLLEG